MNDDDLDSPEEIIYDDYKNAMELYIDPISRHKRLNHKNNDIVTEFLGEGPRSVEAYSTKAYYGKLLAWIVTYITTHQGWKTVSVHRYWSPKPVYCDVQTDYTKNESCLIDGVMLVEKDGIRLAITVNAGLGFIELEAGEQHQDLVKEIIKNIEDFFKEHNFYKFKNISFNGKISFLNARQVDWNAVVIDPTMKKEIRLNTIGFLKKCSRLAKYGVPPKRGIILAGEPGTGKTMACKALISEADNITCITTDAYGMVQEGYIVDLFSIAQDLSPSIVFIEDLDCIGQERHGPYRGTSLLIALLAEMDGIVEKTAIVTVATSNCYETLDKALSERPSRFDRVFKITRPSAELRSELVKHISEKTPLSEDVREYIIQATNGMTPAQIHEVVIGMVISHMEEEPMQFNQSDVDLAIGWINTKKNGTLGFNGMSFGHTTTNTAQNRLKEK
jgi:cell division protease FtsH